MAGEQAVGLSGAKTAIQVSGRTRIPDALSDFALTEVKNVKSPRSTKCSVLCERLRLRSSLHIHDRPIRCAPL
ncbi:putative toxin [Sinomicrobium sp. M5D2P9]